MSKIERIFTEETGKIYTQAVKNELLKQYVFILYDEDGTTRTKRLRILYLMSWHGTTCLQ